MVKTSFTVFVGVRLWSIETRESRASHITHFIRELPKEGLFGTNIKTTKKFV